jgi:hypothetical protein
MAFAFDSLGYAKKLRDAGVAQQEAEAHAEAAREFIMTELATHHDLDVLRAEFRQELNGLRGDFGNLRGEFDSFRREIELKIDNLGLRLTVRLGVMLAAGLSILGAVLGTLIRLH